MTPRQLDRMPNDDPSPEDVAARRPGSRNLSILVTTCLPRAQMVMTLCAFGTDRPIIHEARSTEDAFLVTLHLADGDPRALWNRRHPIPGPRRVRGSVNIAALAGNTAGLAATAPGSLLFHIPRALLDGLADEFHGPRIHDLFSPPETVDPVLVHLGAALLPAFEKKEDANAPFIDQLARTVVTHLLHRYGGFRPHRPVRRGGLSLSQEKRAKAYMAKNHDTDILLADVAKECGLSHGYFIRAFRSSTGLTPGQWLLRYRLEKAKGLLLGSADSIAEIADCCGFADQSHLTRVFTATQGIPPGIWRRQCRP